MASSSDQAPISPVVASFPYQTFDFGGILNSRSIFQADKIPSTKQNFEAVLKSPLAPREWKIVTNAKNPTLRHFDATQHHLRGLHGPDLYRKLFDAFGLPEPDMMQKIVTYLADIHPMAYPQKGSLHKRVYRALKTIKARGAAKDWAPNADLRADELVVEALWALAIVGTTTGGFGVLAKALVDLLNETGLTWIMLPPDVQNVPDCWKSWARKIRAARASDVSPADNSRPPQSDGAPPVNTPPTSLPIEQDDDVIFEGSRHVRLQNSQDNNKQDPTIKGEPNSDSIETPVDQPLSASPAAPSDPDNSPFDSREDAAMNYYHLDTLDDVRDMHTQLYTPQLDMEDWIHPNMTTSDWLQAFEEFQAYTNARTIMSIKVAVVQTLMGPAITERVERAIRDMQRRGDVPVAVADRQHVRWSSQFRINHRLQQATDNLTRAVESAQHDVVELRAEHARKLEDMQKAHKAELEQKDRRQERKRRFDVEEFGQIAKRRRSE
ncbi:hypothetical protein Micbo1qcDRAFT_172001 [Microdochium bolleyi]|uniref:Uncharacterized protein n=1 Tax=Microdochium bolleyi TaxID=196109 RepID=A0A136JEV7_9PEZI|nr:hypothetical protein Micbo1qcDRAFT_172001 [Microdochium bolleyi]